MKRQKSSKKLAKAQRRYKCYDSKPVNFSGLESLSSIIADMQFVTVRFEVSEVGCRVRFHYSEKI